MTAADDRPTRPGFDAPPRFGVNYTPSAGWMHWWLDPDWEAARRDLRTVAGLGADHIRVFPLWPVIQPNRALIRPAGLTVLRGLVDLARAEGLDTCVDVLQGHLSSFDFLPAWLTSWHARNIFTDPDAISGQQALVEAVGSTLDGRPGFLGLTVGNEVNQFSDRPHPTPQPATVAEVDTWLTTLLAAARRASPGTAHAHAEYDAVWYQDGHPFTPAQAARLGDRSVLHSWIFNGTGQAYGGMSSWSHRHGSYLVELARAFAVRDDRPIWVQEVGAPLSCLSAEDAPGFVAATLRHLADCAGLWGVTWWCSHDVPRSLVDFPELEYELGLVGADGQVKEVGRAFSRAVAAIRDGWTPPAPRRTAVLIPVDDTDLPLSRADLGPRGAVFESWMSLGDAGRRPTLVLSSRADPQSLAAQGITEILTANAPQPT